MSLLSICTLACQAAQIQVPSSIVGNSDSTAQLCYSLAQNVGESLARRPQGGWVLMIREHDFTTQATAQTAGTVTNVTADGVTNAYVTFSTSDPLDGVTGDGTWVANGPGIQNNSYVIDVGGTTAVLNMPATQNGSGLCSFGKANYPLPSDFERPVDNTFWDRTRYWNMRGPLSPQQWQIYKSSTIGRASIQRRFRFLRVGSTSPTAYLSIDPVPFDNGSNLVFEYVSNAWCQDVNGNPQSSWQADTDTGILSEYLMRLDLTWRLLRRLGMSYNEEMAEAQNQIDKAVAQDGGAAILDMAPLDHLTLLGPWNVPETNFGNVVG